MGVGLIPFFRAVWWGALAAGAPYSVFVSYFAITASARYGGEEEIGSILLVAVIPTVLAATGTLAGAFAIGLPFTALLARLGREHIGTYCAAGATAGFILPYPFLLSGAGSITGLLSEGLFLSLPGAIAGSVAGLIWGRWRVGLYADRGDHPNRIDDQRILR